MHSMLKRHEVRLLREAGHTQQEVADLTGVKPRTTRRIEKEQEPLVLDDAAERKRRRIGRPSKADAYRSWVATELAREPELPTMELLRRARALEAPDAPYAGAKTAFYEMVAQVRPPREPRPLVRFEGLAGEFTQHDFGQVDVRFVDGRVARVHFFASRLKWSRWVQITIVESQAVEPLVRTLVEHFVAMGGVPLVAVFDRPKTIALKWTSDGKVTEWNSTFIQIATELGIGIELCWPYRAQEKGSVESLVKWVKGSFFKTRRFVDEEDLQRQLAQWHVEVNEHRPSRATGMTPLERMEPERARLRPVRLDPEALDLRYPVQVGPTGRVLFDTCQYSMPPESIGLAGTLYLGRKTVRITAARWTARHPRLFERGDKSILPEHRVAMVAQVSGVRGRRYLKREHLLELGDDAVEYLTEIRHRRPAIWTDDVDRLHELLELHGDDAMRAAIHKALKQRTYGAAYVAAFLDELDRCEQLAFFGSEEVTQ